MKPRQTERKGEKEGGGGGVDGENNLIGSPLHYV